MTGRRLLAAPLLLALLVAGACLSSAPPAAGTTAATVYRLRADPRTCPAPACGGFWASSVNRARTTCLDGRARQSCYIAAVDLSALPPASRARARQALRTPAATLVAGALDRYRGETSPLARIAATRTWIAVAPRHDRATLYLVADTGVRCIRAPCFSLRATTVNRTASTSLSGLDLAASRASAAELGRAHALLASGNVLVSGAVGDDPKQPGGRTLVATQLWLPA